MIRQASNKDVRQINRLRLRVHENQLLDSSWLTEEVTSQAISVAGCGWVFEEEGEILGFSIAIREPAEIWALFVDPNHEGLGIGQALLREAVAWLWREGAERIVLSTDPGTRAEAFYRLQGWQVTGRNAKGETCFERLRASADLVLEDQD